MEPRSIEAIEADIAATRERIAALRAAGIVHE